MADRERLWSTYGGRWRQVSVSYPGGLTRYRASLRGMVSFAEGGRTIVMVLQVTEWLPSEPAPQQGGAG
ncbi:hypothetical protein ACLQ26_21970 [Micromonospora sp. DT43]|uniref:hypothetical protein n=1 Tax=Micromonospora sp. DT43 TaxID=3393440 RepID=UPI003CEA188C